MKVIGYTDVIQVVVLVIGGLITSYTALTVVSTKFGLGHNALAGFNYLVSTSPVRNNIIIINTIIIITITITIIIISSSISSCSKHL